MQYLTPEEVRKFPGAASHGYYALFATAIFTGVRQGQLLSLKWSDWDRGGNLLHIERSYHPKYGFTEPKSANSRRAVIVSTTLSMILKEAYPGGDGLMVPNKAGNPLYQRNLFKSEFLPTLERAKVKSVRFHDLRHTYAALMLSLGVSIKFVQQQLGHATITTTLDQYGHLLPEVSEDALEKFDNLISLPEQGGI